MVIGIAIMIIALLRIRRTRDALDASEKRYRAVVEDQSELISRVLPDGTHIFVNEAYCRFFGKTRDDIMGKQFIPQLSDEEKLRIGRHLKSLTPQRPIRGITNRVTLDNGESRWLFWNNRAIFDKDGNVVEYQSVGRDVTDVKLAEEKVRQYSENLEAQIAKRTQELVNSNAQLQQEVAERTYTENLLATEKEQTCGYPQIDRGRCDHYGHQRAGRAGQPERRAHYRLEAVRRGKTVPPDHPAVV